MKGPGVRIDLDVRRSWRCPKCGRVAKFLGDVVSLRCNCSSEQVLMQLTDQQRRPRAVQHAVVHPAAADEAADAYDQRQLAAGVVPEGPTATAPVEAPVVITHVETISLVEEIAVVVTTAATEQPTAPVDLTPAPETPPQMPASTDDDFGAGLLD